MIKKIATKNKVKDLSLVFYKKNKEVNHNTIDEIYNKASAHSNQSKSSLIKNVFSALKIKKKLMATHKIQYLAEKITDHGFREKWYRVADSNKTKRNIIPFYNLIYIAVSNSFPLLKVESKSIEDCFFKNKLYPNKHFMNPEKADKLINIALENHINKNILAQYLWAFVEAETWHGAKINLKNNELKLEDFIDMVLLEKDIDLLHLCLYSPDLDEKEIENNTVHMEDSELNKPYYENDIISLGDEHPWQNSLINIRTKLNQIYDLNEQLKLLTQKYEYDKIKTVADNLNDLDNEFNYMCNQILDDASLKGYNPLVLPDKPEDIFASKASIDTFIDDIEKTIIEYEHNINKTVDVERNKLKKQLQDINLNIPASLEKAKTLSEIDEFRKEWEDKIKFEKVYKKCQTSGISHCGINELKPIDKLIIFERLSKKNIVEDVQNILQYMLIDPEPLKINSDKGLEILLEFVKKCILQNESLPIGIWNLSYEIALPNPIEKILIENDIVSLLDPSKEIDLKGLIDIYENKYNLLPANLRISIEITEIQKLPDKDKINKLSYLLEKYPTNSEVGVTLFYILYECKHFNEALYLSALAHRNGWTGLNETMVQESFFRVLLKSVENNKNKSPVYLELFSDFNWIEENEESITILLFLLVECDYPDAFINFRFQFNSAIQSAKQKYPQIIEYILRKNEIEEFQDFQLNYEDINEVIKSGKTALNEFKQDMKRTSLYGSWQPAAKYQSIFKKRLFEALDKVKRGEKINPLDSDELIKEGEDAGLHKPIDSLRAIMISFIEKQIERIELISKSLEFISFQELDNDVKFSRKKIIEESDKCPSDSVLKLVYNRVLKENNCD